MIFVAVFFLVIGTPGGQAQDATPLPTGNAVKNDVTTVQLSGEPLFQIQTPVGSFTPQERATAVSQRLARIAEDVSISPQALKLEETATVTSVMLGDRAILTLTDADAQAANTTRQKLGAEYLTLLQTAIETYRESRSVKGLLFAALYSALATILLIIVFKVLGLVFNRIYRQFSLWRGTRIPSLRIQSFELLPADQITSILIRIAKLVRLLINWGLIYGYVTLVLSFFPWTRAIGASLSTYLVATLSQGWQSFVAYLPNLFVVAFVIIVSYYLIRLHQFVLRQLGRTTDISWFDPEWVEPTNKLVTFLVIVFATVIAFPYLPGSDSPAFQGISIFLGLLLSLGSSSAVSNIVAGVVLIYTRAFHIGDRVKIGEAIGDVLEKTLLVTRIRTIKNVVITIPNATVLNSQIVNYSSLAGNPEHHLVLHTTVTLGYDVPWRTVHETLLAAAQATSRILAEPPPFILQKSLDDFYVSYELNAYTDQPKVMAKIYSELHQNIQDYCNERGIEILSPHYQALRDGNQITIPSPYLAADYQTPGFRVDSMGNAAAPSDPSS